MLRKFFAFSFKFLVDERNITEKFIAGRSAIVVCCKERKVYITLLFISGEKFGEMG